MYLGWHGLPRRLEFGPLPYSRSSIVHLPVVRVPRFRYPVTVPGMVSCSSHRRRLGGSLALQESIMPPGTSLTAATAANQQVSPALRLTPSSPLGLVSHIRIRANQHRRREDSTTGTPTPASFPRM